MKQGTPSAWFVTTTREASGGKRMYQTPAPALCRLIIRAATASFWRLWPDVDA